MDSNEAKGREWGGVCVMLFCLNQFLLEIGAVAKCEFDYRGTS